MRNLRLLVEFASTVMPGAVLMLLLLGLHGRPEWWHAGLSSSAIALMAGLALSFAIGHLLQGVAQVLLEPFVERVRLQGAAHWALTRFATHASSRYLTDAQLALLEAQFPQKLGVDFPTPDPNRKPTAPAATAADTTAATGDPTTTALVATAPSSLTANPEPPPATSSLTATAPPATEDAAPTTAVVLPDHATMASLVAHVEAYLYAAKVSERLEDLVADHKLNKGLLVAFLLVALSLIAPVLGLEHLPSSLPAWPLLLATLVAAACAFVRMDYHGRKFAQSLFLLFLTAPAPSSGGGGGGGGGRGGRGAGGGGGGGGLGLGGMGGGSRAGGGGRAAGGHGGHRVGTDEDEDE